MFNVQIPTASWSSKCTLIEISCEKILCQLQDSKSCNLDLHILARACLNHLNTSVATWTSRTRTGSSAGSSPCRWTEAIGRNEAVVGKDPELQRMMPSWSATIEIKNIYCCLENFHPAWKTFFSIDICGKAVNSELFLYGQLMILIMTLCTLLNEFH